MEQRICKNRIGFKRYFLVLATITICFAPFGYNAKPLFSSTLILSSDQFASDSAKREPITYEIKSVVRVIDGDTFEADLSDKDETVLEKVRIRLAGVNSPETFDQNCWKEAKTFTENWFAEEEKVFVETWGLDNHGERTIGFVYKKDPNKTLNQDLVRNGLALPCLGYLKKQVSPEKYVDFHNAILEDQQFAIENAKSDKPSVWSTNQNIVKISAIPNTDGNNESKDEISLSLVDQTSSVDLLGYSLMEESSDASHRFFFPKLSIDQNHPTITVYTGVKDDFSWISPDGSQVCVMSDQDWLNSDGDTVYLRDPDRRIVAYFNCDPIK